MLSADNFVEKVFLLFACTCTGIHRPLHCIQWRHFATKSSCSSFATSMTSQSESATAPSMYWSANLVKVKQSWFWSCWKIFSVLLRYFLSELHVWALLVWRDLLWQWKPWKTLGGVRDHTYNPSQANWQTADINGDKNHPVTLGISTLAHRRKKEKKTKNAAQRAESDRKTLRNSKGLVSSWGIISACTHWQEGQTMHPDAQGEPRQRRLQVVVDARSLGCGLNRRGAYTQG